jgi:predicted PurR-regulated permease PerM
VINLRMSTATRWGLNGLILVGMALALNLGRSIFIPTVIAVLLAAMLWPSVLWLNRKGIPLPGLALRRRFPWLVPCLWRLRVPWSVSCASAIAVLVVAALGVTLAFGLAIPKMLQALPSDDEKAQALYKRFRDRVVDLSPIPPDPYYLPENAADSAAVKYIRGALDPEKSQFVVNTLRSVAAFGGTWLWESVLIMFILLFLLLEGRMLTRRLVEVFGPSPEAQSKAVEALEDIATSVRAYLVWRTVVNIAMAIILGLVYHAAGLGQAWTWALITAILLYVPYLGTILAGIPPVLDAFVTCPSPWVSIGILVFYVFFVTVEGYFIVPVVMGRSMDLNATTVMLACLFWELVWGWAGLFLAMPLMAAAKSVCTHVPNWQPWANLMDTRHPPEPGAPIIEEELLGEGPPASNGAADGTQGERDAVEAKERSA